MSSRFSIAFARGSARQRSSFSIDRSRRSSRSRGYLRTAKWISTPIDAHNVTAVDGDQVTFDVNTGWKGAEGSVTLRAPVVDIALVGPMPEFKVGGRYLVTAAGSIVYACGYTLDYDAHTAAAWAAAFGG